MKKNAIITKETATLNLGRVADSGKMTMFRKMQDSGTAICEFLDEFGEFQFVWNKKAKVWEFFGESGELVGRIKAETDVDASYQDRVRNYEAQLAAYTAQEKWNSQNKA